LGELRGSGEADRSRAIRGRSAAAHPGLHDGSAERAGRGVRRPTTQPPLRLFLAHKAVHPDLVQRQDGTFDPESLGGYVPAERHRALYQGRQFPPRPNVRPVEEVLRSRPAFTEAFALRQGEPSQRLLRSILAGTQEEIRARAAMMAAVDEGVGMLLQALERGGQLDDTLIKIDEVSRFA
jgi:arylsulfatase A-like enzyme